ncbi:glycine zipper 2TM domain-containing protein [Hirschia litorea]|uniref:17 kDa surface antigen n=1 Tax=Hirschia litorea TaxID=1199156 RepID=A0ABW2IMS9_9PROT
MTHFTPQSRTPFGKLAFALAAGTLITLGGCASSQGANDYSRNEVGRIARVDEGEIIASRAVQIAASNNGLLGAATGAVIGGIAGSQVGGGDDEKAIAGVVGAVGGAIAGQQINKSAGKQQGFEYKIRLAKDGQIISITQGGDVALPNGTPVFIEYGERARVVPQNANIGY